MPWKLFPEEAMLDEPEKNRRNDELPSDLKHWLVDRIEHYNLLEHARETLHFWEESDRYDERCDEIECAEAYSGLVMLLLQTYFWAPADISQEARAHLERIHAQRRVPEDLEFSDLLLSYLETDPEARFEAFVQLRTHHRSAFLRTVKLTETYGNGWRRAHAPEVRNRFPLIDQIMKFGDLKPKRPRRPRRRRKIQQPRW